MALYDCYNTSIQTGKIKEWHTISILLNAHHILSKLLMKNKAEDMIRKRAFIGCKGF